MKSNKILLVTALLLIAFTSCTDDLKKADFDYKPDGAVTLSSLRFDALEKASDEAIRLQATITDAGKSEIYDYGFLYSTTENFAAYTTIAVEPDTLENGDIILLLNAYKIAQGKTFYFKVYALAKDGLAVSSDVKSINLPVTWVTIGSVELTDNTYSGDTYPVDIQKFEGQNRYRLVDPFVTGEEEYISFELDENWNALQNKMQPGEQAGGFYWHPNYVGVYCNFFNDANVYTFQFLILDGGSLYTGGEIIFEWIDGYPGEIPEAKLSDFNALEYEDIPGAVRTFTSDAFYGSTWEQAFSKAIDIDAENPESQYKNLYYLPDLYAEGYGLAFYFDGTTFVIPENQPTGITFKNKPLFVSQSKEIESELSTTAKGAKIYTLGLTFHYKDGAVLGNFAETFVYSEEPLYTRADFTGNYTFSYGSAYEDPSEIFDGGALSIENNPNVPNGVIIRNFYLEDSEIEATVDLVKGKLLIPDVSEIGLAEYQGTNILLVTANTEADAPIEFILNADGKLVCASMCGIYAFNPATGAGLGWWDKLLNATFTPATASGIPARIKSAMGHSLKAGKPVKTGITKAAKLKMNRFAAQPNTTKKASKNILNIKPIF